MIPETVWKYNLSSAAPREGFSIADNFFMTAEFSEDGNLGLEEILFGLTHTPAEAFDAAISSNVAGRLFGNQNGFGDDLPAREVQGGFNSPKMTSI